MSLCPFCEEIATDLPPDRDGVGVSSRRVFETHSFVVFADISPLTTGHLIVVPRSHVLSFGAVVRTNAEELAVLVERLARTLRRRYCEPLLLEHGSDSSSDGGGCVAHAHLHFIPVEADLTSVLHPYSSRGVSSFQDLAQWADEDRPYVFVGNRLGVGHVADQLQGIPKQFIRIEVAKALGLAGPLWDWRSHILTENLTRTVSDLKGEVW